MFQSVEKLSSMLQASIGPVAIISGVALLLLSISNRNARVFDKIRALLKDFHARVAPTEKNLILEEIQILHKRALLLRSSILFSVTSIFFASMTIFSFFTTQFFSISWHIMTASFFFLSLLCLVISLVYFIRDVTMSLDVLSIEIEKCCSSE